MDRKADAVIIGGGALGTSIFFHLTQLGLNDIVLLEKGLLGSGSTRDTGALVRQHYSNPVSIRLVLKSIEIFKNFSELTDGPDIYHQIGWIFLVPENAKTIFRDNMRLLKELGVKTEEITPKDVAESHLPGINLDNIACAAFEPDSGWADPHGMVSGFANKAKQRGARYYIDTPARGIRVERNKVQAVITDTGEISTPVVINAAGPWAKEVGQWCGLDLPLEVTLEPEAIFKLPRNVSDFTRSVSSMVDKIYLRPESGHTLLIGTGHPKESESGNPNNYSRGVSFDFIEDVSKRLLHRFPFLEGAEHVSGFTGLYTVTRDWNMILGPAPEVEGLYLAVGGSGHSFKLAPAVGLCLAELIMEGQAKTIDISPLRPTRFEEEDMLKSTYGGNRA
jgi:sarcosine oxidase, subunit beta